MKYDKLFKHVSENLKKTSRYRGLMLNKETGAIFPASAWGIENARKEKRIYNEHTAQFFFMPGNICVLNVIPLATYDLVPYGMTGKFVARRSYKSEYTYIHELFDLYESFPGMKVSMLDGKPLDARPLDKIQCDPVELKKYETRLNEIKRMFFVLNRMKDEEPKRGVMHGSWHEENENRRDFLIDLFTRPSLTGKWTTKLEPFYAHFYGNARGYRAANQGLPNHNNVFDNMIRFDKAALFRALKVIV
jgi:hypothetical protein